LTKKYCGPNEAEKASFKIHLDNEKMIDILYIHYIALDGKPKCPLK